MKLSRVQRIRFVACIKDLKKLVSLARQEVPNTTIGNVVNFVQYILTCLKGDYIDKYCWFDLNGKDLAMRLKVSKKGVIMGCVTMTSDRDIAQKVHFRLNQFIEGSMLRDPDIEYYESA